MKTLKIAGLFVLLGLLFASCGRNYLYKKIVVNNTREPIQVQLNFEHDSETVYTIQPGEEKVVFICTYQSYIKPDCSDVSNRFILLGDDEENKAKIQDCANWKMREYGKDVECKFVVEEHE